MTGLRLYKREKLCSLTAIDLLWGRDSDASAALAYPLRAVWRINERRHPMRCPQFMIVVPKKRLRHAVDRVTMRRRIREAYRLNRHLFPQDRPLDISFIYVADKLKDYATVNRAMIRLLGKINAQFLPTSVDETDCE